MEDSEGIHKARMESIRVLLVYVDRMYRDMNLRFKGPHFTLGSWAPYRDKERWRLHGEEFKMAKFDRKWEGTEKVIKPKMVIGVPRLGGDLLALGMLTKDNEPPQRKLRAQGQLFAYLMGYASGICFGSVFWGQERIILESQEFTPLYQGRSSIFQEGNNLTSRI